MIMQRQCLLIDRYYNIVLLSLLYCVYVECSFTDVYAIYVSKIHLSELINGCAYNGPEK